MGVLKKEKLEKSLEKCLMYEYKDVIQKYILSALQGNNPDCSKDVNFLVPDVITLCNVVAPELGDRYVEVYDNIFGEDGRCSVIPRDTKIVQACLLDTLQLGLRLDKNVMSTYTLDVNTIFDTSIDDANFYEKCLSENYKGNCYSYRIDIEYSDNEKEFTFKEVKLTGKLMINEDNYVMIPYLYISTAMSIFETFLNSGIILKLTMDKEGASITRFVTMNNEILKEFCNVGGNSNVTLGENASFFSLSGFFYAPVIGAPLTTSMVTKVNLLYLNKVENIKDLDKITVEKVSNPLYQLVAQAEIINYFCRIKDDDERLVSELKRLPEYQKYFLTAEGYEISFNVGLIGKYLNSIKDDVLRSIVMLLKLTGVVDKKLKHFTSFEKLDISKYNSEKDISDLLKNSICKFVTRKRKNCGLNTFTVTNNKAILQDFYGDDYFGSWEGLNIRFGRFWSKMVYANENGLLSDDYIRQYLNECGFTRANLGEVISILSKAGAEENLKNYFSSFEETKFVAPASTNSVLARTCFAVDDSDLYRRIVPNRVLSIIKFN